MCRFATARIPPRGYLAPHLAPSPRSGGVRKCLAGAHRGGSLGGGGSAGRRGRRRRRGGGWGARAGRRGGEVEVRGGTGQRVCFLGVSLQSGARREPQPERLPGARAHSFSSPSLPPPPPAPPGARGPPGAREETGGRGPRVTGGRRRLYCGPAAAARAGGRGPEGGVGGGGARGRERPPRPAREAARGRGGRGGRGQGGGGGARARHERPAAGRPGLRGSARRARARAEPSRRAGGGRAGGRAATRPGGPRGSSRRPRGPRGSAAELRRAPPRLRAARPPAAAAPMSSYFVNPLYSKYKAAAAAGEAINPTYYDCHFAPEVSGRHAAALQLYGNSAAGFPHAPPQAHAHPHPSPPQPGCGGGGGPGPGQDYFHAGAGSPAAAAAAYQAAPPPPPPHPPPPPPPPPCGGIACHGEPAKFYGYDNLQRQPIFTTQQEAELVQYPDCKSSSGNIGEDPDHLNQSSSPSQMFPWMRPQGWDALAFFFFFLFPKEGRNLLSSHVLALKHPCPFPRPFLFLLV